MTLTARAPRSRRWAGVAAVVVALATCLLATSFILPADRYLRARALTTIRARLGRHVSAAAVTIGLGHATLREVVIRGPLDPPDAPLVESPRVAVSFALLPALRGQLRNAQVVVEHPRLNLRRLADGRDNYQDLLARRAGTGRPGSSRGSTIARVAVLAGSVHVVDEERGIWVRVAAVDTELRPGEPQRVALRDVRIGHTVGIEATVERMTATLPQRTSADQARIPTLTLEGGRVAPLRSLALTGITGTITPGSAPGRIAVDLRGGYGGVERTLWTAAGEVRLDTHQATLDLTAARFTLDQLAPILQGTPVVDPDETSVDASLKLRYREGILNFDGTLTVSSLNLFHPLLAAEPVRRLDARARVDGSLEPAARRLTLREATVRYRGVQLIAVGQAEQVGTPAARYELRLKVPPVPCATALQALPAELTPSIRDFRLAGTFRLDLHTRIDMTDLDATELGGLVGIRRCRVLESPPHARKLEEDFEHEVEFAPGQTRSFWVGPTNPDFVTFDAVSPAVFAALTTTEDGAFFRHHGFIGASFRSALIRNLKRGYFALGASSITMQLVKNTLLSREKTLARKLQELFLTWFVELRLTKERIMEAYLNVIEFGPDLYGIGAAARHYFGKHASSITPLEAAFFSSILPNPKKRYVQYCRGTLSPSWDRYVRRILRRMHERGRITDEEYAQHANAELVFSRDEFLGKKECLAAIAVTTGEAPPSIR